LDDFQTTGFSYITGFVDDRLEPGLLQLIPAVYAAKPATHNQSIDIEVISIRSCMTATLGVLVKFGLDLHVVESEGK
jgi:hypothetical protein